MAGTIVRVSVWKDTNGSYHESEAIAQLVQDNINFRAKLAEIIDDIYFHNIQPREIVNGIMDHITEIREILK